MNAVLSRGVSARPLTTTARKFPQNRPRLLPMVASNFQRRNESPWWLRDPRRIGGSHDYSWTDIFSRGGFRCVYCYADLSISALTVATATHDHVVPQCLFNPSSEANRGINLVACCATCNSLKGDWHPNSPDDPAWQNRADFVSAAPRHIEKAAAKLDAKYRRFVGRAKRHVSLESWEVHRRSAIAKDRDDYTKSAHAKLVATNVSAHLRQADQR